MRFSKFLMPLATVLALAACGGGGAASPPASAPPASKPAAASAPASVVASKPAASASAKPAASAAASAAAKPAESGAPAAGGKTAKIGAAFSLTGAGGPYGPTQKNAALMAQDEINKANSLPGWQVQIDVQDDASDKTQAINVVQKFIKDNDVAIMGPTLSNSAFAADPEAVKAKVPVLGVSTTADGITDMGDYVFRDSLAEAQVIPNTIKIAKDKLNLKKVAVMYANDDAFSKSGFDVFKKALDGNSIQITDTEAFSVKDTDFTAQLTKIKATNPDAIVVSTLADSGANIVTQARKLGIPDNVRVIGGNGFNSPQIAKVAGKAADGVIVGAAWISSSTNPASQKFVTDYKGKYNQDPDQFAAQAHAGVYILADAMKRANLSGDAAKDRDAIRMALTQAKDLDTVLGKFSFTPQRDANHPPVVQAIQDGKFVLYS